MKTPLVLALALAACGAAHAGDAAYTVRPTDLKAKPFLDAPTVASLGERSKVEIVARQSSWTQVKSGANTGWVKMLNLRLDNPEAQSKSGNSGIGALFNLAKTGSSGTVATTGVRGLNEEQLKNASPNGGAVDQMAAFAVDADDAKNFAKAGKLNPQKVEHAQPGRM